MSSRFGPLPMLNLIIALREQNVSIGAIKLHWFTSEEQEWLRAGYEASMTELVEAARKLEGK